MLLADPYARKKSRTPSKNRVWNFFDPSKSFTGDLSSKTQCSQWEKPETTTTTASEHSYFSRYEAYGTRPYEWGSDPDRQKANTKEEEKSIGLLNEGMRFRDLEAGVFLTGDPIGFKDGPNRYCYVHCNPVTKFDPFGLKTEAGDWIRTHIPAIIGVPVAGAIDAGDGVITTAKGGLTASASTMSTGLKDMGEGVLSAVGLKEFATEGKSVQGGMTGTLPLPESLGEVVAGANTTGEAHKADAANGMHGWHANSNAELASRLGPLMAPVQFLGGIAHELDPAAASAEKNAQGTVNAVLDAVGDIVANTLGIGAGLVVPPKQAGSVGRSMGNLVPGPGDPDPHGKGTGGYNGNPIQAWSGSGDSKQTSSSESYKKPEQD